MTPHAALKIPEFADRKRVKGILLTFFPKKGLVLSAVLASQTLHWEN